MRSNLPTNWETWRLGDVGQWSGGGTPSSTESAYWDGDIPWVSPKDMKVHRITTSADKITEAAIANSAAKLIPDGSVLFVTRSGILAHSFPVATTSLQVTVNQDIKAISTVEVIDPNYLAWALRAFERKILTSCSKHGTTVHSIEIPALKVLCIPVPPFPEQHRIVAKIEELFSELDKAVESLTTAREQLDLYSLVILHQALIDHDGHVFPARPLDELIGEIGQGWSPKCDVNTPPKDGEWAIIKTTVVQPMSYLGHECKPLPGDLQPKPSIEIRDGDLLMTRKGPRPRTGVVCHVRKARPHSMLCDTVYRFRAREDVVLPEYLEIALNAPAVVQEINARKSGISESGISLNHGKLRSLPIPVPVSLTNQARIAQIVRERISIVEHQCALIAEQIQRVEALRQAILKRALSGQLVAQAPADEPASLLLERIHAEREESGTPRRRNNKNGNKEAA